MQAAPVLKKKEMVMIGRCVRIIFLFFFTGIAQAQSDGEVIPEHHRDLRLQQVLSWTPAQREAIVASSRHLQAQMDHAIASGTNYFRIPPGDYTDWRPKDSTLSSRDRSVLSLRGAENMTIDASGATFWKNLSSGSAVIFADCKGCTVTGLTADMLQSPFVQGVVSDIIPSGWKPGVDKIILDLEKGFYPAAHFGRSKTIGRNWRMDLDGSVTGYISGLSPVVDESEPPPVNQMFWMYKGDVVDKIGMQLGERLSVHVKTGSGGVVVENCGELRFEDMTIFSSGVFGVWERGVRSPGGNTYSRLKIIPRPGSTRIGVGAMDGFHSFNQRRGPALIDCEIARVHDDGVNIHGFINVVLGILPDHKYILASIHGRDYDVGSELFFHRAPDMAPQGATRVRAWEPFDQEKGMDLYGSMQKRFKEEYGTKIRGVIEPEFNVVSFEQSVSLNALDMACSQEYCGKGARISNLHIHTGCNRGVIVRAPDAVIENSRFENIEFGGLALCTSLSTFLEGGLPNHAKILNNSFENCGGRVFGGAFRDGVVWGFWGAISVSPSTPPQGQAAFLHMSPHVLYHDIEIRGNRIQNTQGLPVFVGNSRNVTVADNLIIKPFQASREKLEYLDLTRDGILTQQYAPAVPDDLTSMLKEPFYGVFVSASENVNFSGNNIVDAPSFFRGVVGVGPWSKNVGMKLDVSP